MRRDYAQFTEGPSDGRPPGGHAITRGGEPADVCQTVTSYGRWLAASPVPKLFINADPGTISAEERAFCRSWPSQAEVTVPGLHFLQEDSPHQIGQALARWHNSLRS